VRLSNPTVLDENKPEVFLVYLVQTSKIVNKKHIYGNIARIKGAWPEILCVSILKYASQLDKAKEVGSDLALVEGVNAERLLAAIEGKFN
jgi:uncharacterized protein with NAD-binding domain and iron-sulfur cluster